MKRSECFSTIAATCVLMLGIFPLPGCSAPYPYGEFGEKGEYEAHNLLDNPPVILVHGIKGGKLVRKDDSKKTVWGNTGLNVFFHNYDDLALYPSGLTQEPWDDHQYYNKVDPLKTIEPEQVLQGFIVGWDWLPLFEYELYGHLVELLTKEPIKLLTDKMVFLFAYDWRLDNRVSAVLLAKHLLKEYERNYLNFQASLVLRNSASDISTEDDRLQQCVDNIRNPGHQTSTNPCQVRGRQLRESGAMDEVGNVRFTIVTHSMGGLVGRYLATGLRYSDHIHKLILFGSPNLGGMDAMKAVVEGERPPSLLHYLGLEFFGKEETRKVHLSFGSIFQLFPRYPGAVINPQGAFSVDVTEEFGLGKEVIISSTIRRWKALLSPLGKDLKTYFPVLERYLEFQLESARCFHLAIADRSKEIIEQLNKCDEAKRIAQIVRYLERYHPSVKEITIQDSQRDPPIINLGGHCYDTLTVMLVEGDIDGEADGDMGPFNVSFLEGESSARSGTYHFGDNRVPTKSLAYPHTEKPGDVTFLVCKDHMGIIKDEALQYNLLRAIFLPAA